MTEIPQDPNLTPAPTLNRSSAAPAAVPETPVPTETQDAPAPLSSAAALMLQQFKLLDPNHEAIGLNALRPFYKRIGWDVIMGIVHELEAAKLLKKRAVMNPKGGVGYHVYTWQEV